jgi:uncharacterized protein
MSGVLKTSVGTTVCDRCVVAANPATRLRGLLGRKALRVGEGLLIRPTQAIHPAFMRFAIDAVFLDRELRVVAVEPWLKPWRAAGKRKARSVLELRAGETARIGLSPGTLLHFDHPEDGTNGNR